MAIAPLSGTTTPTPVSTEAPRAERAGDSGGSTMAHVAEAVADGVSATVSLSGKALHALEEAGERVLGGAAELAAGTWHGLERAAEGAGHVGEAVAGAVAEGAGDVVGATRAAARQLGHYAAVGMHAAGDAVSDVASGTVMAASAAGKTLMSLI
jgi:hypothetical protein